MGSLPSMHEFVLAIAAAFAGGFIFRHLRQPPVLGFLVAGIIVGPHVTGIIKDVAQVQNMAQMGVAFLMFQAGTELSLSHLRKMQRAVLLGPFVQLLLSAPFVAAAILLSQWPASQVGYLALIFSLSSTTVAIKLLSERGELDSVHGRLAVAFSIVQDIPLVPAIVLVTSLASPSGGEVTAVLPALGKALAFVFVGYTLGARLAPPLLRKAASYGRELLILCVVLLALGMAYLTGIMGLSLALGAFMAGLVIADSEVSRHVLREVSPISDIFITFFFVSVGMLLDIPFVLGHIPAILALVLVIVVGKALLIGLIPMLFRHSGKEALLTGLVLAQIGEEAFLLAQVGFNLGFLSGDTYSLVLAVAVISIVLNPFLYESAPVLLRGLKALPILGQAFQDSPRAFLGPGRQGLKEHTILCGYGEVGQQVVQALEKRGLPYTIIELDPHRLRQARDQGLPCIFGDASREDTLHEANIMAANSLIVTIPDPATAERVVRSARRLRKGMDVLAKGYSENGARDRLANAGATEVVHPSLEASLEFIRCVLRCHGVSQREVERFILAKRAGFYS
ncbi:MAG: cation:proton antiporter [Chloroflexi bacterium]|nr:cation:proton antiporter [Chloroflexota bacterium]